MIGASPDPFIEVASMHRLLPVSAAALLAVTLALGLSCTRPELDAAAPSPPPNSPGGSGVGVKGVETADPLPSWNEGPTKRALRAFVTAVTDKSGPDYVPPAERIAVFDNDGTLWIEQPIYNQIIFAQDRARELAPRHPHWKEQQPFKAALDNDIARMRKMNAKEFFALVDATHTGMSSTDFDSIVKDWFAVAKHPRFDKLYTQLVYQPMLEVITYLQSKGFKTFIVSGGGLDFMRGYSERVYGIPPENLIGTSVKLKWEQGDKGPILLRLPALFFYDNEEDKPIGIQLHIGRRPLIAFGNSDGDLQMLQWTAAGKGKRLMLLVHHDDAKREYAYDRDSPVGKLDKALDEAHRRRWNVISMKDEWRSIFP